jgi:hypothetical protein
VPLQTASQKHLLFHVALCTYCSVTAYGMHIRVRSAEEEKNTSDSSVAATFMQPRRGTENDAIPSLVPVEYVGWVEEIVELNYGGHCVIVLVCLWMKARTKGPNCTVKRDEYRFTLAKLPRGNSRIGLDSFAFPINVQQVFFSDDDVDPNWKVVCKVDVRSRRALLQFAVDDSEGLNIGRDVEFDGLNREYGYSGVLPDNAPEPEVVYILDMVEEGTTFQHVVHTVRND